MRGIIYTRVSSDEQVKGMSLDFQRDDCIRYAKEKDIELIEIFEERGESAKFADRPELIKLLEYCRKHKRSIQALIVWKLDRLSRNQMDYYFLKRTLLEYGVSLHSATEPSLDDTSSLAGRVFETFSALQAEIENTVRRERTMRGMEAKIMSGISPWKPPLGYQCGRTRVQGLKKMEPDQPDPERFPLIVRLFRTCLEDQVCNSVDLARFARAWGLRTITGKRIYPQIIDRMFSNRFYAGTLINRWAKEEVEGRHQRAISPEEFEKIQWLRNPRRRLLPKGQRRNREHTDFPLRRTVRCADCLTPLTGAWSRGNGGRYPYYFCRKKGCEAYGRTIPKATLEALFARELTAVTPNSEMLTIFKNAVLELSVQKRQENAGTARRQKVRLQQLEEELQGLIRMKARELVSDGDFLEQKTKLKAEIAEVQSSLRMATDVQLEKRDLDQVMAAIADFPHVWHKLDPSLRRRFEKTVFPGQILFDKTNGVRTDKLGLIYETCRESQGSETRLATLVYESSNQIAQELMELSMIVEEIRS